MTLLPTEHFHPECGRRGVLCQIRPEVRRPDPGEVHHLGLEIRPVGIVQVSTGFHLPKASRSVRLSLAQGSPRPLRHLPLPAAPRVLLRPSWDFTTYMRLEAGPAWAEGGTSGPFVGWGWGLQGREALPSFPSDCNRTQTLLFPSLALSGIMVKLCNLFWAVCVCVCPILFSEVCPNSMGPRVVLGTGRDSSLS